jgi:L-ascorbate metabolism protein UlaG (beta-lactamase superfamily)
VLESDGATAYFAADTYYGRFMERIAREHKPNVVLMPVASFRLPPTMGGTSALSAARILSPEVIIPIHLGITPRNPLLRTSQTPESFRDRLRQAGSAGELVHLREGESWSNAFAAVR